MSFVEQLSFGQLLSRRLAVWRIQRLVRRYASTYLTAHPIAATAKLKVSEWPGLLAYVTIARRADARDLLFAYWRTREDFERHANSFTETVSSCQFEGFVGDPRETWMIRAGRFFSYNTVVLTLVAILGALQSLGSYGNWIFLRPSLHVITARPELRYVAGDPIDEIIRIANRTSTAHHEVRISEVWLEDERKRSVRQLTPASESFETLAANSSEDVPFHGTAPHIPGTYTLNVRIESAAGWIRRRHPQTFQKPVELWASGPQASKFQRTWSSPTRAEFVATLAIGSPLPNGMECDCMVTRHPGPLKVLVAYPLMSREVEIPPNTTPGKEVAGMRWLGPQSSGLQRVPFRVVVSGTGIDGPIENQMQVNCYANSEPSSH